MSLALVLDHFEEAADIIHWNQLCLYEAEYVNMLASFTTKSSFSSE
jgi:hypothetical protein